MRTQIIDGEEKVLTRYQVHRDENRTQCRQLRENIIDLVVSICHFDGNLRQVVGVRPGQDFFVVI